VVVGAVPFTFVDNRPQYGLPPTELYKNILNPRYRLYLPSRLSSPLCDLIKRLLAWDPLTRLGCLTDGAEDVKGHAFFEEVDWQQLLQMEIPPPHVPELSSATDMSNFDEPTAEPGFLTEPEYDYSVSTQWDIDF
jgi:serine/threonine protein kinase